MLGLCLSASIVRIIRVAPRLYGCHGLSKLSDPISSSIIPPLFLPPELQ